MNINLTGQQFGRLTALRYVKNVRNHRSGWECVCACGETTRVVTSNLLNGNTRSCGCLRAEEIKVRHLTHSETANGKMSVEYRAYALAKNRCTNPNATVYAYYGGRGIEFRFQSFSEFLQEVGRKPSPQHSLNRIDNDGHYEPGNIAWATQKQQTNNQRQTRTLTINGLTQSIAEWAEQIGMKRPSLWARWRRGWCSVCLIDKTIRHCAHRSFTATQY